MSKIIFRGVCYPMAIRSDSDMMITWTSPERNIEVEIQLAFKGEEFIASCRPIRFDIEEHLTALQSHVSHLAQVIADFATIKHGQACSTILASYKLPDGSEHRAGTGDQGVQGIAKTLEDSAGLSTCIYMALQDPTLAHAARDLADSLRHRNNSASDLARCIETVRNYFVPEGGKRSEGWAPMRQNLKVSEEYLRTIIEPAHPARHGHRVDEDFDLREMAIRAWTVMDRFLAFRRAELQGLSLPDFSFLA
jgi:hypothetical protein